MIISILDMIFFTIPILEIKYNLLFMNSLRDIDRHPFIFILTPFLKLITILLNNPKLALILFQAFIATINNIILFLILKKIIIRNSTVIFFTLIYAFSYSTLLFVSIPEFYLYSACVNLMLTWFVFCYNSNEQCTLNKYFPPLLLSCLCVLGFGINLINIILYIPLLIYFFLNIQQKRIQKFIIFLFFFFFIFFLLLCIGEIFYPLWENLLPRNSIMKYRALEWIKVDFSIDRLLSVIQETLVAPFYALESTLSLPIAWNFSKTQNFILLLPMILFIPFYKMKLSFFTKQIFVTFSIVMIHLIANFFYNNSWFLYSQNYLFLLIVIYAHFYSKIDEKIQNWILGFYLIFQTFLNVITLTILMNSIYQNIFSVFLSALYILFLTVFIMLPLTIFFALLKYLRS